MAALFLYAARGLGVAAHVSIGSAGQPITDAQLAHQDAGLLRVLLDLTAQLAHQNAQIVRVMEVPFTPHFLQQDVVRDHVSGVLRQDLQQAVFFRRQHDTRPFDENRAPQGRWRAARA